MLSSYVLDTHPLLWFLSGDRRLGSEAKRVLEADDVILILPAVVVAEAVWIAEHGRVPALSPADVLSAIRNDRRVIIHPLDFQIVEISNVLSKIREMHDRLIVATVLAIRDDDAQLPLITRDENIIASGLLPTIW